MIRTELCSPVDRNDSEAASTWQIQSPCGRGALSQSNTLSSRLRRQTIGLLKILIEGHYDINLHEIFSSCSSLLPDFPPSLIEEILQFMTARAKGLFEEFGFKKDEINASLRSLCMNPYDQFCQVQALHIFRKTPAFPKLFEVYKRAKGQLSQPISTPFNPALALESAAQKLLDAFEDVERLR